MAAGRREAGRIPVEKWRKHMHWFSLLRFHAELVANDTEVQSLRFSVLLLGIKRVVVKPCLPFKSSYLQRNLCLSLFGLPTELWALCICTSFGSTEAWCGSMQLNQRVLRLELV